MHDCVERLVHWVLLTASSITTSTKIFDSNLKNFDTTSTLIQQTVFFTFSLIVSRIQWRHYQH